jgi:hypothetical protein
MSEGGRDNVAHDRVLVGVLRSNHQGHVATVRNAASRREAL